MKKTLTSLVTVVVALVVWFVAAWLGVDLPFDDAGSGASGEYAAVVEQLGSLPVKGRAPMTGYAREEFGPAWKDVDRNGCDTRNDILRRDLTGCR